MSGNNTKKFFGTDGIRGIAGKFPLTKNFVKQIALYSAFVLKKKFTSKKFFIGWDTRESSNWISKILMDSLKNAGFEVHKVGVFPTSGIAYLCKKYSSLGVVISASHNPYEFNGIKFFSPQGIKLADKIELEIEQLLTNKPKIKNSKEKGIVKDFSSTAELDYLSFLEEVFKNFSFPFRRLKLVIDCANGSTYKIAQKIFTKFFPRVKFINIHPNGKNINKNCGSLHPEVLLKKLNKGQIGICFDGDGDRVIFVDENKNIRDGDYIIGILATEYKRKKMLTNCFVIPTVMSNLGLLKYLWSKDIKTILAPVGDKYVYEYMKDHNSILGGEQSGHIILWKYLQTGDGIITALEILKVLLENKTTLFNLSQIFNKYPQVLKNIKTNSKPPVEKVFPKNILKQFEKKIEGRIFIRYSGTEPLLRIMAEGKDKNKINEVVQKLENIFIEYIKK